MIIIIIIIIYNNIYIYLFIYTPLKLAKHPTLKLAPSSTQKKYTYSATFHIFLVRELTRIPLHGSSNQLLLVQVCTSCDATEQRMGENWRKTWGELKSQGMSSVASRRPKRHAGNDHSEQISRSPMANDPIR